MKANVEQIRATASRMEAWGDEFWNDVEELIGEVRELMGSDWLGEAAATHAEGWSEWEDGARSIAQALSGDAALLYQAADGYSATEADNRQQLDTVQFHW